MLKLGTVFSGIGAIEQALIRLDINHEIEFACDNGDIEIDINHEEELKKIKNMNSIEEKKLYVDNLYKTKFLRFFGKRWVLYFLILAHPIIDKLRHWRVHNIHILRCPLTFLFPFFLYRVKKPPFEHKDQR